MGHTADDYDLKAQELGWDNYTVACREIADRFGFETIQDLEWEIENVPGGFALLSDMTDEEYELWIFDL